MVDIAVFHIYFEETNSVKVKNTLRDSRGAIETMTFIPVFG
jgi:hypothetical protein